VRRNLDRAFTGCEFIKVGRRDLRRVADLEVERYQRKKGQDREHKGEG